jgi:hypothetical protein
MRVAHEELIFAHIVIHSDEMIRAFEPVVLPELIAEYVGLECDCPFIRAQAEEQKEEYHQCLELLFGWLPSPEPTPTPEPNQ